MDHLGVAGRCRGGGRRAGRRVGSGGLGAAYLPDHAVPHAAHPLAMLAVGHQVQVVGELDHLGQLLEDVDAEALTAELGVGGCVTAAATKKTAGGQSQRLSQPGVWALPRLPSVRHTLPPSLSGAQLTSPPARPRVLADLKLWLLCRRQGTVLGTQPPVLGSGLSTMTKGRSSSVATVRCRLSTTGCREAL